MHCCCCCCCHCWKTEYMLVTVAGRIILLSPKDVHILISGKWISYVLHQRGIKFAVGIRIANQLTWRWRIILDCPSESNVITGSLKVEEESQRESIIGRCPMKERHREMKCSWLIEDGGRVPLVKGCEWLLEARENKEVFFPRSRKEHNPANTLFLVHWDPF